MKKLFAGLAAFSPMVVFAAVPEAVTTALTAAGADSVTVAAAVLGIIVGVAAFRYMKRAL